MARPGGKPNCQVYHQDLYRLGALAFKARLLRGLEIAIQTELGPEEGSGYVCGPALKPDTEDNMLAVKAWIESFKI